MAFAAKHGDVEILIEKHKPTKFLWRIRVCTQIIEEGYDLADEATAVKKSIERLKKICSDVQNLLYSSKAL